MRITITVCLALIAACASSQIESAPSQEGVEAYRAKDYQRAWALLAPLAGGGHYRAQRYLAFMLLEGNAPIECIPDDCASEAVKLLLDGARRGDNNSLIVLEAMRASEASYAPSCEDMIEIEMKRAGEGDPMTAWRLAKRYQTGDGVVKSAEQSIRWLKIAAKGDAATYAYATDAAFMVCQAYASGEGVGQNMGAAQRWCKKAADNGHGGAVIALSQIKRARRK